MYQYNQWISLFHIDIWYSDWSDATVFFKTEDLELARFYGDKENITSNVIFLVFTKRKEKRKYSLETK